MNLDVGWVYDAKSNSWSNPNPPKTQTEKLREAVEESKVITIPKAVMSEEKAVKDTPELG